MAEYYEPDYREIEAQRAVTNLQAIQSDLKDLERALNLIEAYYAQLLNRPQDKTQLHQDMKQVRIFIRYLQNY